MSRTIMLIPTDTNVSLTSISLGIAHVMKQKRVNLAVFKPIAQSYLFSNKDQTTEVLRSYTDVQIIESLDMNYVQSLLVNNQKDTLMEAIVARYHDSIQQAKLILIEGLMPIQKCPFAQSLNYDISKILGADVIFVTTLELGSNAAVKQLKERIQLFCVEFGGIQNKNITGVIINEFNTFINKYDSSKTSLPEIFNKSTKITISKDDRKNLTNNCPIPILGYIPWNFDLITTRVVDIANNLNATIINKGALQNRRIKSVIFCTHNISNTIELFSHESLLVTSSDRYDVIVSICLAVMNGIKISGLLLTNGYPIIKPIYHLCHNAFKTGLPVLLVETNILQTLLDLQNFNLRLYVDDRERIEKIKHYIALHINQKWINSLIIDSKHSKVLLSPPAFRYRLTQLAHKANKCIVLPEGDEPRTVKAAAICAKKNIAKCILLGEPNKIKRVAAAQEVELGPGIEIIVPKFIRENYVRPLIELRKNKGMTEILARKQLEDNVVLGTMMLEKNEVDGLVSGAVHTTADTVRPALQLIKTIPGNSIVSSIFFMLLPEQVLVYGDCAINPNPTTEQLSEIAIQSADSAKIFGIEPRIAMISYSTGSSSTGSDVNKVYDATRLVQEKRPDLIIDGPLQYDAAIIKDVAKFKAPNSPVAGQATIFIFPDLNTGNTTYKAVQRSANIVSIGPILQGLRKPVNDLSRGALVDDIIYTIAISAIQATQK